jgi:transposase
MCASISDSHFARSFSAIRWVYTVAHLLARHIQRSPTELRELHELLRSIPGIGSIAASHILAEAGELTRFADARAVAAYAGLTPRQYRSGTSVQRRTQPSKIGNAALRRALFFPAIVAKQHNANGLANQDSISPQRLRL